MFEDFKAVATLDVDAQRALLRDGDGPERLWAAWALALRAPAAAPFATALGNEPSEGVRAGLCTVLAACGESAILCALATADPASLVRTNACRLLCRIARPEDTSAHAVLRDRLASDSSSDVRLTIVDELSELAPAATWSVVRSALEDADEHVRRATVVRLGARAARDPEIITAIRARVARERVQPIRDELLAILLAHGGTSAIASLVDAESDTLSTALALARRQSLAPEPELVEMLSARRDWPVVNELLGMEEVGLARIPITWLLDVVLAAWSDSSSFRHGKLAERALDRALGRMREAPNLSADSRHRVRAIVERLDGWIQEARAEAGEEMEFDEEVSEWMSWATHYAEALRRLAT